MRCNSSLLPPTSFQHSESESNVRTIKGRASREMGSLDLQAGTWSAQYSDRTAVLSFLHF
jgi:hypothetical protein